ncbi:MAG: autotransporter assembly complex family protein [Lautropia sp.]
MARVALALGALGPLTLLASLAAPPARAQAESSGEGAQRATPARADEADTKANYALEIDAPDGLAKLIRENTLLGRWQYRDDFAYSQRALFVRRAPQEIRELLSTEGYFEPEVDIEESLFKVSLKVWAGPRSTVNLAEIRFEGELQAPAFARRRSRLLESWGLPEGSFFNQRKWTSAKRAIVEALRNEGFPRARIADSRAAVDLEKTAVALDVRIDSGPQMRIGTVSIDGLERYDPDVVTNLQTFRTGDVYSLSELLDFQTRVRDTRYFTSVTVLPDLAALESDPERRTVDIRVEVVEAQSERLTLGVGYSTDRGVRGQIGWIDRNWIGRAYQLETKLIVDQVSQQGIVSIRTPLDVDGRYWATGLKLERTDIQDTVNEIGSVFVGRGRRREDIEYFASLTYQVDRETITALDGQTQFTDNRALVPGYSWNIRRLDSRLYPTAGYTFNAQVSGASRHVASTADFVRGYARTLRFVPMPRQSALAGGVLLLVGEAGIVGAGDRDGIPSENLFRAGGSQSVRGYAYQSLGVARGESIVGGRYLIAGTVEYQHPIAPTLYGAVFYDRGGAGDTWTGFSTVAGYGVGLRWRTPVGPVNFDLAWADALGRFRFHFSIGYTF